MNASIVTESHKHMAIDAISADLDIRYFNKISISFRRKTKQNITVFFLVNNLTPRIIIIDYIYI